MKKILCYIFLFVFSFKSFGFEISRDTPLIKDAAAQVDYLFNRNDEIERTGSEEKKWYIYFLGENAETLKYIIEDSSYKSFSDDYLNQLNNLLTDINTSSGVVMYVGLTDYTKPIVLPFFPDGGTVLEKIEALRSRLDETQNIQEASESEINIGVEYLKKFKKTFGEIVDRIYEESVLPELESKDYILPVSVYHNITVNKFSKNYHSIVVKRSEVLKEKDSEFQVLRKSNTPPFGSTNDERTIANIADSYQKILSGNYELPIADVPIKKPFELTFCDYLPENKTVDEYGVTETIKKLNAAHLRRNAITDTETPRNKGDFYHLINVSEGDLSGKAEVIEDKLYLLKQKTGINFYVVFQPVVTKMNIEAQEDFAKLVLEGSDLKGSGNTVLITVPFLDVLPTGSMSPISCIQPGFVQSSSSLITSQGFKEASDLFSYVLGAFKEIEKPVYLARYFESVSGELVRLEYSSASNLSGLSYINAVRYYRSRYAGEKAELENTLSLIMSKEDVEYNFSLIIDYQNQITQKVEEGVLAENQIGYDVQNNIWKQEEAIVSQNVGLFREPYITNQNLVNQFIDKSSNEWAYRVKFDIVFNNGKLSKKHFYNIDNFSIIDPAVYGLIDVAGLIPGIDNFADPVGMLYAGYRDNSENIMAYSLASAITGAGAMYFKAGGEVFGVVAKLDDTGDLSYVVRSINGEVAENELQLTSSYVRQKDIADETLTEIQKQQNDEYIKSLILAKKGSEAIKLADNLTGSLKAIYDDLVSIGLKMEEKANTILFKNEKGETVANIFDNKFTPVKWKNQYRAAGYSKQATTEGYIILEKDNDIAFDLGFNKGRVIKAEEVNDFLVNSGRAQREGQPYLNGSLVEEIELKAGDKFYVVEYENIVDNLPVPNPGGFGSKDPINTIQELREKLAVLEQWKNSEIGTLVIREYEVVNPIRSRSGIIGPQVEKTGINTGKVYPGGAHQYEFYDYIGNNNWKKFLKCVDDNGIKLK